MPKLIQINSHDRLSGTPSDFTVNLGVDHSISEVRGVLVKSIQLVNSFYNIDTYNNRWYYKQGAVENFIDIPRGQYNVIALLDAIVAEFLTNGITATAVDDPLTHVMEFTFSPAIFVYKNRDPGLTPAKNPIHRVIGLRTDSVGPLLGKKMDASHDLSGVKTVYVMSNTLAGGSCVSSRDGGRKLALLDTVPVIVAYGGVIHTFDTHGLADSHAYDRILSNNLSSVDIQLRDSENNLLNTNGLDVAIVLKIL